MRTFGIAKDLLDHLGTCGIVKDIFRCFRRLGSVGIARIV